jgi:Tfp pilus assembly protein PilF
LECAFGQNSAKAANNAVRILRNHRGLHYQGRVHNCLMGVKRAACTPIRICHHGFVMDRDTQIRRFKRTTELLEQDIIENPQNPRPHHFLAASYLSENMLAQAAHEAERAIILFEADHQLCHNYLWSIYIAASAYLDLGQVQKAESLAQKGIRTNPDHLDSYYLLALIAYRQKDPSRFSKYMDHFLETKNRIEKDPSHFGEMVHNTFASQWLLHLLNAFLLLDGPDPSRFQTDLTLGQTLCPDPFLFYQQSGSCYLERKDFAQAKKQYVQALELKPDDTRIIWILTFIYERLNEPSNQIILLEKLLKIDSQFPHAHFQLALVYMRLGNYKQGHALFAEANHLDPDNRLIQINMALCLRGMERYEESIRASAAIQTGELLEQATLISNLAYCHYALGQMDQALIHFQKWSEFQPQALEPPVYLAKLLLERQEFEACVVQCDRLLTLLELNKNQVLNSLEELGSLFLTISRHLARIRLDLSQICEEIGRRLGCRTHP